MAWYTRTSPTAEWTLHTGAVVTADGVYGLHDAIVAAADGTLILAPPYTYQTRKAATSVATPIDKTLYVKGLGASPDDTVLYNIQYQTHAVVLRTGGNVVFDNMKILQDSADWYAAISIRDKDAKCVINKCNIVVDSTAHYAMSSGLINLDTGYFKAYNCFLDKGNKHVCGQTSDYLLPLSKLYFSKVELDTAFSALNTVGELASADYVTTPAEGYGYNYGEDLIAEDVTPPPGPTYNIPEIMHHLKQMRGMN